MNHHSFILVISLILLGITIFAGQYILAHITRHQYQSRCIIDNKIHNIGVLAPVKLQNGQHAYICEKHLAELQTKKGK